MDTPIQMATILAIGGCAIGLHVVPTLADILLRRRRARLFEWFDRTAGEYERWQAENPGRRPSKSASGTEGAIAYWAEDALRLLDVDGLDEERASRVRAMGIGPDEKAAARTQAAASALAAAKATVAAAAASSSARAFMKPTSDASGDEEKEAADDRDL